MSTAILYTIRAQLGYYGISTLLITGNIGNLFLILMLRRSLKQHPNSCSIYLLVASFANLFVIDTALVSTLYSMDHLEPTHSFNILCKLRWFGGHVLFMLSRCCMIAACIDRWALCSQNVKIRSFSQPRVARRMVIIILCISIILPIPLFVYFDNGTGRCILSPPYVLAYTTFAFIAIACVPLLLMIVFTLLTGHNLHRIRSRVIPAGNSAQQLRIHKRDHDLMKMLAGEVIIYIFTQFSYPANLMYGYFTSSMVASKSEMRLAIEALINFIIHPILSFTYCCTQFYVCAFVSASFRKEFIHLFRRRVIQENLTRTNIRPTDQRHI